MMSMWIIHVVSKQTKCHGTYSTPKKVCYADVAKYYSHILCGGSVEKFRFGSFYSDLVTKSLIKNPEAELELGLVYFDKTTTVS